MLRSRGSTCMKTHVSLEEALQLLAAKSMTRCGKVRGVPPDTEAPPASVDRRVRRWPAAAAELGVSLRTLRNWVSTSDIRPVKLPGRTRSYGLRLSDLEALIEARK